MNRTTCLIALALLTAAGCGKQPAAYCSINSDCAAGESCVLNTCVPATDMALDRGPGNEAGATDLGPTADAAAGPSADRPLTDLPLLDLSPADLPGTGATCSGDTPCATGFCVDGFCCDNPCASTCHACNVKGKEGTCSPIPQGTDPDSECTGSAPCGGDVCDGAGACTKFAPTSFACKSKCHSSNKEMIEEAFCDGSGQCGATFKSRTCSPYLCDATTNLCSTACNKSKECVAASACDRSKAHVTGVGTCIATQFVKVTGVWNDLLAEIAAIKAGTSNKTHIRLNKKTYSQKDLNIVGPIKLTLVGDDGALLRPLSTPSDPVITIQGGVELTLQGVTLSDSSSQAIYCQASTPGGATLKMFDGELLQNGMQGLYSSNCNVEIRRSRFDYNKGGAAELFAGSFTLVNNLFDNNGTSSSNFGGLSLAPGTGRPVVLVNNTFVQNKASSAATSALVCKSMNDVLRNNVLYDSTKSSSQQLATGCNFVYSRVPGAGGGTGNIATTPILSAIPYYRPLVSPSQCPTIDAGQATNQTVIDKEGNPRPATKGGKVDMGAYEVK